MSKTIAAVATGNSAAGISVIRISGDDAIKIADRVFSAMDGTPLSNLKGYTAKFGNVKSHGENFDTAVALVFRAPKSYTGENVVELSVHGGLFIVEKTLEAVFSAGAVPAQAGEFTKRAFLNGKMDLTQAESVASLISAQGQEAAKASFNLLQGSLSNKINIILNSLIDCSATMAAWVDYPDEEIPELSDDALRETLETAKSSLADLINNYESGIVMTQGVDTAIVGKPNAGKSTLMNMLSGEEKSIVTHIKGTTRDIVEGSVRLGSIVLHLSDTAGIRESDDLVESIGIQKAMDKIDTASLVLAVFDSSSLVSDEDKQIISACKDKTAVAVINKTDLGKSFDAEEITSAFNKVVYISAKNGDGAESLEKAIKALLGVQEFDSSQPMLANRRQKLCVENALAHIETAIDGAASGITFDAINVMIDSAVDELLSLTGKKATEEVVNNIFSRFCVGK
ncbi:MAG: tRNA uridine-5-carboxymethylaminomethyl(34) synthesis GTPase MnmE [Acetobacter sp.]|nr:tRNA uridine-5-carboxymethylaminomethyl(34) synthesis GTPase MnmE [Bacteroides sp.]MCM1340389.1 tRNA uridine-5-carboxymethylaminomethyl(34) synthesis GTPase MnmE [Acetobacter sp.]MCM1432964.1 tRNA uridine-5-carboxymethylaminomethyl(34) synthesis GTPase MnmE [Clostridiales bacterium]